METQRTLILVLILLLLFLFLYKGREDLSPVKVRHGIMIDAGGTGSRIHVFQFAYSRDGPQIVSEIFEEVKPGLSSFVEHPEEAAMSLLPLIEVAKESIPPEYHQCTPIALKAALELRMIPRKQAVEIFNALKKLLRETPFFLPPTGGVEIMDGGDKGVYTWMTVNFLLDRLGKPQKEDTVAIMDLDGGSAQVVFEPKDPTNVPKESRIEFRFGRHGYTLYQQSYLGLGLLGARGLVKARAVQGESSCLPLGFEEGELRGASASSAADCEKEIVGLFDKTSCPYSSCSFNGIYQPRISTFPDEIYAFSYFYDRTESMETPFPSAVTVDAYSQEAGKFCGKDLKHEGLELLFEQNPLLCLDLNFIFSLLKHGFGIKTSQKVLLTKKIKGYETGWCMGAMMKILDEHPHLCRH